MPDNVAAHMIFAEPGRCSLVLSNITGGNQGRTAMFNYWCNDLERYSYINGLNAAGQTYYEYRKTVCWGNVKPRPECSHIEFETKKELANFYDSINTKFFLYLFNVHSVDVNVNAKYLPWMQDYTKPWDNKRFCDYFKITGYISDTEAVPGSEWRLFSIL